MFSRPRSSRFAFTLIETATSLSVMSILLLGLASSVMIGARAIPSSAEAGLADQAAVDTLNQLREDLRHATTIKTAFVNNSSASLILSTNFQGVPGAPSTITYQWTNSSSILTRRVGIQFPTTVIDRVKIFKWQTAQAQENENENENGNSSASQFVVQLKADTIQGFYELHVALPYSPEVQ